MNVNRMCIVAFACAIALLGTGCASDTQKITKDPPVISSVLPAQASFGDTIVAAGHDFNGDLSSNRIVIAPGRFDAAVARRVIVPFAGSRTELRGVVPDGAFSGGIRVENVAPAPGIVEPGVDFVAPSVPVGFEVLLRRGEVGKSFFSGPGYGLTVSTGAYSEDYLVVVFSDAVPPDNMWDYHYDVHAGSEVAFGEGLVAASKGGSDAGGVPARARQVRGASEALPGGERDIGFELRIEEQIRRILERAGARPVSPRTAVPPRRIQQAAPAEEFYVLKDVNLPIDLPSSYQAVQANLRFNGEHTLLYVDAATPADNLTQADINSLGLAFDEHVYAKNRATFGDESDINGDGKVAILMTPGVNRLTPPGTARTEGYIAGYFLPNDLLPGLVPSGATNGREIFYTVVPDPTGAYGNVLEKTRVLPAIEAVLAHEFLHMILFNYRVLIYGGGTLGDYMETVWLNEGLAHIAEDVNGYTVSNVARANLFLTDPGGATLVHGGDRLAERGASFLFLRLIGDRYGDAVFRDLVQSKRTGTKNVAAATDQYFLELFADWAAALWLSNRTVTSDPRFNYTSLNLRTGFDTLLVIPGTLGDAGSQGSIKSMAPEFLLYTVPLSSTVRFRIEGGSTGRLNAVIVRVR